MSMKRKYSELFKRLFSDPKERKYMMNLTETFKSMNENKTSLVEWDFIRHHPIFCLGKNLFYKEEEMKSEFFIKTLGCAPNDTKDDTKDEKQKKMTIIEDYDLFRTKILHTLENRFDEFY